MASISVTMLSDPGCPWGYSDEPMIRVLRWRYEDQLDWRLVMIGLTERYEQYVERGYTPLTMAHAYMTYRDRFGMPFSTTPKARVAATALACRTVVAARLTQPGSEWDVFRALQYAWFTTPLVLDEHDAIATAISPVPGLDVQAIVSRLDDPAVVAAYEADRAESRSAAGSPSDLQGKTAQSDGPVRYTAASLIFEKDGRKLEAGGFQLLQVYDACVVNLDPTLVRQAAPDGPLPLLERFRDGLTTIEVAYCLATGNDLPDVKAAEHALLELVFAGRATRTPLGNDAVWRLT
jgi:predicted DsbA family dithiol-disulfide isomerase